MAGLLGIFALKELIAASPALADWFRQSLEPLRRARGEGYLPTSVERLRLALTGMAVAVAAGWYAGGPVLALVLAASGPAVAGYAVKRSRRRYRRAVEKALPDVARAIADSLSAGHSPRGAVAAAATSLEGPAATEFLRVRHGLELGHATTAAIRDLADRFRSERVDAFATALVSQRTAGGDLAALLRRFADGAAERDRVFEDARSATAQARFTGYLVVAMPVGGALFTELIQPGFIASLFGSTVSIVLVSMAVGLQLAGFLLISRLAKVGEF
ncbi:MAG: type II secretion system F family protein [Actinomycetota bacterium]|nr:type II secretion system F family protein [Actinomycetota bacterium]